MRHALQILHGWVPFSLSCKPLRLLVLIDYRSITFFVLHTLMISCFLTITGIIFRSQPLGQYNDQLFSSDQSFNSQNKSPCVVASEMAAVCNGGRTFNFHHWDFLNLTWFSSTCLEYFVIALPVDSHYTGPNSTVVNPCQCSSVFYSLLSACADCQNRTFVEWVIYPHRPTIELIFSFFFHLNLMLKVGMAGIPHALIRLLGM